MVVVVLFGGRPNDGVQQARRAEDLRVATRCARQKWAPLRRCFLTSSSIRDIVPAGMNCDWENGWNAVRTGMTGVSVLMPRSHRENAVYLPREAEQLVATYVLQLLVMVNKLCETWTITKQEQKPKCSYVYRTNNGSAERSSD